MLNKKHLDIIDELCAPDYHGDRPDANRAAFKQFYQKSLASFPGLHVTFEDAIAEGHFETWHRPKCLADLSVRDY